MSAELTAARSRQIIARLMGDRGKVAYGDTRIDAAWTQGMRSIASEHRVFYQEASGNLVPGQMNQSVQVAGLPIQILDVLVGAPPDRTRLRPDEMRTGIKRRPPPASRPYHYWLEGTVLMVYPPPATALTYLVRALVIPAETAPVPGIPVEAEVLLLLEAWWTLKQPSVGARERPVMDAIRSAFGPVARTALAGEDALSSIAHDGDEDPPMEDD